MYKKFLLLFLIIFTISTTNLICFAEENLILNSPSAILIESTSGRILYEKNIHEKMYPASITKIMTAIITLEKGNLNDIVTASSDAVLKLPSGSSNIGILPGEILSLENLLYGLLVASGNEAANVIAEHISGSCENFVITMNQKAKELGANNTNFINPHGLHDDEHVTTAYDMALISKYAMTIPKFREIVSTAQYEISPTNKYKEIRYLSSTHHLINRYRSNRYHNYFYKSAIGIKTGYTSKALHTLVSAAKKDSTEFITVVMGANVEGNKINCYEDTITLLDYGFNNFDFQTVVNANDIVDEAKVIYAKHNQTILLQAEQPLKILLPKNIDKSLIEKELHPLKNIKAPVSKGDLLGFVIYKYQDEIIGKVNLISDKNIERDVLSVIKISLLYVLNMIWFKILLGMLIIYVIIGLMVKSARRNKRRSAYLFANKKRY